MNRKRIISLLLCLSLSFPVLCGAPAEGTASADGKQVCVWKVCRWEHHPENLKALNLSRPDKNRPILENYEPFSAETAGFQSSPWIVWVYDESDGPYHYQDMYNVIPEESGFNAPRSEETVSAAAEALDLLGLNGESWQARPLYFCTLGRYAGGLKSRKAVFEETLEGLPVRWSEESLDVEANRNAHMEKCVMEVVFSDEHGLMFIGGNWCTFEPVSYTDSLLSEEEITSVFTAAGRTGQPPEKCWFMHLDGRKATAVLAWRVGNSYINAIDGSWLQACL